MCRFCHRRKHISMGQEHYKRIIKVSQNQNMWVVLNTLPTSLPNINGCLFEESEAARHDALLIWGNNPLLKFRWSSFWPLLGQAWIRPKTELLPSQGCLTSFHLQSKCNQLIPGHKQKCRLALEDSVNLLQNQGRGGLTFFRLGAPCWTVSGCAHCPVLISSTYFAFYRLYYFIAITAVQYFLTGYYNARKYFH